MKHTRTMLVCMDLVYAVMNGRIAWLINVRFQDWTFAAYNTYKYYNSQWRSHQFTHLQSTVHYNTHWVLLVCCLTLILGYRLSMVHVRLPGFQNCFRPTDTATLESLELGPITNSFMLCLVTDSLELSNNCFNWTPFRYLLHWRSNNN
jgi:hypothetical protein